MHEVAIKRTFARRADDEPIGTVTLKGEASLSINDKPLPGKSIEYLANFALQSLQDAYAGAGSYDEACTAWKSKLDKLVAGTIGMKTGGIDPWLAEARKVFRPVWLAALEVKDSDKAKLYKSKDTSAEDRNAMLDEAIDKNREAVEQMVEAERAERAKRAEAAKGLDI